MAEWVWEGRTRSGEVRKGTIEADTEKDAHLKLRQQNIKPDKIKKKGKTSGFQMPTGRVKASQLVIFVRQFSTMIDAGLPLVQCLDILSSQEPHKGFKRILLQVKQDVESGATFADSLRKHPSTFDTLFVNLVAAGEIGGILDTILNRLAAYIEKNVKLKRQVKSALTYPIGTLVVAMGVVFALLKWVIPTFEGMFKDMGGQMPALTQLVINASHWFQSYWYYVVGAIMAFLWLFKKTLSTEKGRTAFDTTMLKMPLIGSLIRKIAVAKFTRTLGTMVSSGVPILDALEIVAKSAGNKVIESAIYFVRDKISEGSNMADPLAKTNVFPSMVVQMIAVGESTGAMDTMLQKIADFYEDEVEVAVESVTKMIEPLMMVFVGGIVGTVLIAMYLPIFSMAGNVK
ncbi:type II secretion system F family protein [Myxococcota bacterium]|nr:type II secretion system F family protein [Myxococcota bacterium]MBU1432620.1 type II secretion system F family protein [Myxococcota bacterium]MBU1899517.1 type II secretion system F family protein [Myxococcota bacterium]